MLKINPPYMTLYEFILLDENERWDVVLGGAHIGGRADSEHWILLFQVGSFYAEVFYHKQKNVIVKYNPFTSTELLQPYLSHIDISSLLDEAA